MCSVGKREHKDVSQPAASLRAEIAADARPYQL
jgi:hypothetical protein